MKVNYKVLVISLFVVFFVALIGSLFNANNTSSQWYESVRPSITPPGWVFPIVWNVIFFLIALSLYFVWINSNPKQKEQVVFVYLLNFVLNILWTILYFSLRRPDYALVEIFFLLGSIIAMIIVAWRIDKKASVLLWPYLVWVSFASVLNWLSVY